MLEFIKARLSEKSTWAGIFALAGTALGWVISPENIDVIASGFAVLAGVVLAAVNSSKPAA
jgi:membrane protein DedA with SNARE-associated domain